LLCDKKTSKEKFIYFILMYQSITTYTQLQKRMESESKSKSNEKLNSHNFKTKISIQQQWANLTNN